MCRAAAERPVQIHDRPQVELQGLRRGELGCATGASGAWYVSCNTYGTMDTKTHDVLDAINRSHREIIAKQEETLEFLRAQAERSDRIRQEAVALQKQAVARFRRMGYLILPVILACIFLVVHLITKYRIL